MFLVLILRKLVFWIKKWKQLYPTHISKTNYTYPKGVFERKQTQQMCVAVNGILTLVPPIQEYEKHYISLEGGGHDKPGYYVFEKHKNSG